MLLKSNDNLTSLRRDPTSPTDPGTFANGALANPTELSPLVRSTTGDDNFGLDFGGSFGDFGAAGATALGGTKGIPAAFGMIEPTLGIPLPPPAFLDPPCLGNTFGSGTPLTADFGGTAGSGAPPDVRLGGTLDTGIPGPRGRVFLTGTLSFALVKVP